MAAKGPLTMLPEPSSSTLALSEPAEGSSRLPIELVVIIMKELSPQDLRNTAVTCHQYHTAAYHHAGLFIEVFTEFIEINGIPRPPYAKHLATFREVVKHATLYDLRISLNAWFDLGASQNVDTARPFIDATCTCITEALPLLVALQLVVGDTFRAVVDASLCHPAPHLRSLDFSRGTRIGEAPAAPPLPSNLFGGFAPRLVFVNLEDLVAGDGPAFSTVRTVHIGYDPKRPPTRISNAFPVASDLTISRRFRSDALWADATSLSYDLRGLSLKSLAVRGYYDCATLPAVGPASAVYDIPLVEYDYDPPDWCTAFWATVSGVLNLRIVEVFDEDEEALARVTIVPQCMDRVRIYQFDSEAYDHMVGDAPPLTGIEFLCPRLAYVRVEAVYVFDLLHITSGFPHLRRLQIDVHTPEDSARNIHICPDQTSLRAPCPVLEKLVIFAMDKLAVISVNQISSLAIALVQTSRTPPATLSLVGGSLGLGSIASAFPTVEYRPFTGIGSDDDYDSGLWDH